MKIQRTAPLLWDPYELLHPILGCSAPPSNSLLIQLVVNCGLPRPPLHLHVGILLTYVESKYLCPNWRVLILVCFVRGELNYLILQLKQQYYIMLINFQICVASSHGSYPTLSCSDLFQVYCI